MPEYNNAIFHPVRPSIPSGPVLVATGDKDLCKEQVNATKCTAMQEDRVSISILALLKALRSRILDPNRQLGVKQAPSSNYVSCL